MPGLVCVRVTVGLSVSFRVISVRVFVCRMLAWIPVLPLVRFAYRIGAANPVSGLVWSPVLSMGPALNFLRTAIREMMVCGLAGPEIEHGG